MSTDDPTRRADEDDATQAMPSTDEPTQLMDDGESTQLMAAEDEATQGVSPPTKKEPTATRRIDPVAAVTGPVTERLPYRAQQPLGPWITTMVAVIALILGTVIGYLNSDPSDDNLVARALVGPDGGVMAIGKKGKLEIPKGALPTMTAITIRKEGVERRVRLGPADDPRSIIYEPGQLQVYVFEPSELRFQQPVRITLPKPGEVNGVIVDSDDPRVIAPTEVKGDVVVIETMSFSFE